MRKILIANRGEIAVRVARACRDAGYTSVAVYAEPDIDALHVRVADEAFALGGNTPGDSYLRIDKILDACKSSGADAVHPGYGFLSENADFAEAVIAAGLTWIGPPPEAIRRLGDKTAARHIALEVGAPLAPGTADPVAGVEEVVEFAKQYGLPVAIKAAFGGGGRGLKVAWTTEELPELFDSAVREAVAAFGRGECFVERYLDQPRHVETQVLADTHGNVVVVGTRDCSLQRRYQKLVEEAPAPFLSEAQLTSLYDASKAICRKAGYVGAGTVEFLVARDGMISFLEVNTRLQVEHPVTEEVSGVDLVRAQFRIAEGEALDFTDPAPRGHSFEFRINGEDPGRNFLPAPGTVTSFVSPAGPGVRLDTGIESGSVIGGAFDSLLAKLIITGATRQEALERARRALDEMVVDGMATALPFHRAVVRDPAFAPDDTAEPFRIHNRWIETEFDNTIPAFTGGTDADTTAPERQAVVVEVGGKRLEVVLPAGLGAATATAGSGKGAAPKRRARGAAAAKVTGDALTSPMQGTIVKVAVSEGDTVATGDLIIVLEAMKMEQPINAHRDGKITDLAAAVGSVVTSGAVLCEIKD
ncbi:biotin carboxylase N-terminal domain-containing protein [Frankia sp. R82]|uniref:acetyl/propionyl/methylcrotonyl-CoA carboxylase subunit alpha n=1 Tax=Frankia sp. R82 TaxID=2950553 RepID=UPI0020432B2E|nr:biotin carboxylase N-terminal domain-containing protein [Frankia sp. R82]MCM3887612.1 biotin/lipoyl-binding protein [Frankia sp. R82]